MGNVRFGHLAAITQSRTHSPPSHFFQATPVLAGPSGESLRSGASPTAARTALKASLQGSLVRNGGFPVFGEQCRRRTELTQSNLY